MKSEKDTTGLSTYVCGSESGVLVGEPLRSMDLRRALNGEVMMLEIVVYIIWVGVVGEFDLTGSKFPLLIVKGDGALFSSGRSIVLRPVFSWLVVGESPHCLVVVERFVGTSGVVIPNFRDVGCVVSTSGGIIPGLWGV